MARNAGLWNSNYRLSKIKAPNGRRHRGVKGTVLNEEINRVNSLRFNTGTMARLASRGEGRGRKKLVLEIRDDHSAQTRVGTPSLPKIVLATSKKLLMKALMHQAGRKKGSCPH